MSDGNKADSIRARMLNVLRGGQAATTPDPAAPAVVVVEEAVAAAPDEPRPTPAEAKMPPADPCDDEDETDDDGNPVVKPKPDAETAAAARASATAEANARWATVLRSEQAAGRMDAAVDLLAESAMTADKITGLLGKLPAANATGFAARMQAEAPNPPVSPDGGPEAPKPTIATRMAARHAPKKEK